MCAPALTPSTWPDRSRTAPGTLTTPRRASMRCAAAQRAQATGCRSRQRGEGETGQLRAVGPLPSACSFPHQLARCGSRPACWQSPPRCVDPGGRGLNAEALAARRAKRAESRLLQVLAGICFFTRRSRVVDYAPLLRDDGTSNYYGAPASLLCPLPWASRRGRALRSPPLRCRGQGRRTIGGAGCHLLR